MEDIRKKVYELAQAIAADRNVQIVDVELSGHARKMKVRVFIDKDSGVSLEDCEKFSRAYSALLDVEDLIKASYVLEVSSPGLDRPLKSLKDFEMNTGKLARVVTRESIDGQTFFIGRIGSVVNETVRLLIEGKNDLEIPYSQISKARLEIEI